MHFVEIVDKCKIDSQDSLAHPPASFQKQTNKKNPTIIKKRMFITVYWSSTPQKDKRKIKWGAGKLVLEPRTGHNLVSRWVSEAKPYNEVVDRL